MERPSSNILIVDPDAASRNYLAAMLQKAGYTILLAPSGREGLITAWKDLPNVIVLDPALTDLPAVDLITRLRNDRRSATIPVVALSSRESRQESAELLSAGCNEYLVKSSQALAQLLELLPRLSAGVTVPPKMGTLIAFLSAKGGTGTSSLCANMAMCLGSKQLETRVAVADLVLPIGSIANITGYNDRVNLFTAAAQTTPQGAKAYFKENLPRISNWYFHLLAGSPDPESANKIAIDRIEEMVVAIQETFDYVFVDLGRSFSRFILPIIKRADLIALILSSDLAAVVLTRTVVDYLQNQGLNPQHIYPILNRAVALEGLTKPEAEQILGLQIRVTMPYMGSNFTLANNRHDPVMARFPDESTTLTLAQASIELVDSIQRMHPR